MGDSQKNKAKVIVSKNGPYLVSGNLLLEKETIVSDNDGNSVEWRKGEKYPNKESYALCRCGQSKNKPYCDGTHLKINFNGEEAASRQKYIEQAEKTAGPEIDLSDEQDLCALARFCHNKKGNTWDLTEKSDNSQAKEEAIKQAGNCPSGRLVAWDKKTGQPIEPEFAPSISLVEDPEKNVSGPIWLKGEVELESGDGSQ